MKIKEIKFGFVDHGVDKFHTFAMGLGPCGRWVTELQADVSLAALTITQTSYAEDINAKLAECHSRLRQYIREEAQATGSMGYDACGWDNIQWMIPSREVWLKHYRDNAKEMQRLDALRGETKVFVYKLEDIRGRITALQ